MKDYKELMVWKRAMELTAVSYSLIKCLPGKEEFALASQIRRSAISIPSNIAEGYGRGSAKDYIRFLSIARGSHYELETQLLLCVQLGYCKDEDIAEALRLGHEVGKMLNTMIAKLTTE